jgi:hypothetical protein
MCTLHQARPASISPDVTEVAVLVVKHLDILSCSHGGRRDKYNVPQHAVAHVNEFRASHTASSNTQRHTEYQHRTTTGREGTQRKSLGSREMARDGVESCAATSRDIFTQSRKGIEARNARDEHLRIQPHQDETGGIQLNTEHGGMSTGIAPSLLFVSAIREFPDRL